METKGMRTREMRQAVKVLADRIVHINKTIEVLNEVVDIFTTDIKTYNKQISERTKKSASAKKTEKKTKKSTVAKKKAKK